MHAQLVCIKNIFYYLKIVLNQNNKHFFIMIDSTYIHSTLYNI